MGRNYHQDLQEMAERDRRDSRIVQSVVGMACGFALGIFANVEFHRKTFPHHPRDIWLVVLLPILGLVGGGAIGYFKNTWRSAL